MSHPSFTNDSALNSTVNLNRRSSTSGESVPYCYPFTLPEVSKLSIYVTTRFGGVSTPPYATWNLGHHVDDHCQSVASNRERHPDGLYAN